LLAATESIKCDGFSQPNSKTFSTKIQTLQAHERSSIKCTVPTKMCNSKIFMLAKTMALKDREQ